LLALSRHQFEEVNAKEKAMRIFAVKVLLSVALINVSITSAQTSATHDVKAKAPEKAPTARAWDAKTIVWQREDSDGTKWAVLEGDKDDPGKLFTYAFFIPANYWEHHWHTQDARVAVISGALRVAQGDTLDKEGAKTYPVGSYLLVPANVQHTMGADIDTIIIGTALGPWKTHHHEEHEHEHHH
jgi:quercetin dioxygenase-like cupin family protein